MESFAGKLAVVTGGGSGMGRELVRQLAAAGCSVATCDVDADGLAETAAIVADADRAGDGVQVSTFRADVAVEADWLVFRDHVTATHGTDHVHLLFNNAGIGGGGSFLHDGRDEWERTFAVCWSGVYLGTRTFLPLLVAAPEAHLVNTSSVNGFWACLGPDVPHTAYSAAKFAVKGFTEALLVDLRLHAPHVRASVVMPGHIGTSIAFNSALAHGRDPKALSDEDVARLRQRLALRGIDTSGASDEDLRQVVLAQATSFRDQAPTTAADAAAVILAGVRDGRWRILVGDDARRLDAAVRADPEAAYDPAFMDRLRSDGVFASIVPR
jgi:NAD(P)-dependent dehydrogenase (short-subunit alcohol dehydrogenase family)